MKLDIVFAGAEKEGQRQVLLEFLEPLGIDRHTVTEARFERRVLEQALITALRHSDLVIIVGGLGNGRDDFTTPLLCEGLGLREEICPAALEQMKKRYKVEEESLSKEDLLKVKIPSGAHALLNRWGDCPGYALAAEDQCIVALPDGAAELAAMAEEKLLPYLQRVFSPRSQPVEGGVFGLPYEEALQKIAPAKELAKVLMKKEGLGLSVKILPDGEKDNTSAAAGLIQNAMEGGFFTGGGTSAAAFVQTAATAKITLAAAEPEGRGEVRRLIGQLPGQSRELPGMEIGRKTAKSAGVPRRLLRKKKGASPALAVHMANSARERFGTTLGIGITRFRPAGRRADRAFVALCDRDKAWVARIMVPEERLNFDQELAATAALDMARRYVAGEGEFLFSGTSLSPALSGKVGQVRACTIDHEGTAVWRKPGEKPIMPKRKRYKKEKKASSPAAVFGKTVLAILLAAALLAAGAVGSFYWQAYRAGQLQNAVMALYQAGETGAVPDGFPAEYDRKFAALWMQNQDIVGWLSVPDTDFSFPVVRGQNNTYYSLRNFNKEPSLYGTAFLSAPASLTDDVNLTMYGNNMEDGQMFAHLEDYRKLSYYREHPIITFDGVQGGGNYKVCAVFLADPAEEGVFDYESFQNPADSQQWEAVMEEMQARSLLCTPVDIREGDKLLTLSTRTDDFEGARLIVMARKTRSGEVKAVKVDEAVYNAQPVLPQQLQRPNGDGAGLGTVVLDHVFLPSEPSSSEESSQQNSLQSSMPEASSEEPAEPSSSEESSLQSSEPSSSLAENSSSLSSSMESSSSSLSSGLGSSSSSSLSSSAPSSSSGLMSSTGSSDREGPLVGIGGEIVDPDDSVWEEPESSSRPESSSSSRPQQSASSKPESSSSSRPEQTEPDEGAVPNGETFIVNGREYDAYDAVCRVVAAELGNGNYEALKAQAVASYTLLAKRNQNGGGASGVVMGTPSSTVKQAVQEVWGEALYANGNLMEIFYFAISAGRTNEPREVWGGSVAGYGSVDSSWDENVTSAFERTVSMDKEEVIERVWEYLGIDLSEVPVEDWFTIESYTSGGYNDEMTVGGYSKVQKSGSSAFRTGAAITGRLLRESVLGLRSACFTWEEDGDSIVFTTKGYGHGVGMSQWGAIEMAKQGYDYEDILLHYYPGASIK